MFIESVYEAQDSHPLVDESMTASANHNWSQEFTKGIPCVGNFSLFLRLPNHYAAFPDRAVVTEAAADNTRESLEP
jgi:hypothetical protein